MAKGRDKLRKAGAFNRVSVIQCSITFDMFGRNTNYRICDVSQLYQAIRTTPVYH